MPGSSIIVRIRTRRREERIGIFHALFRIR
jgi:hypothetical protein